MHFFATRIKMYLKEHMHRYQTPFTVDRLLFLTNGYVTETEGKRRFLCTIGSENWYFFTKMQVLDYWNVQYVSSTSSLARNNKITSLLRCRGRKKDLFGHLRNTTLERYLDKYFTRHKHSARLLYPPVAYRELTRHLF